MIFISKLPKLWNEYHQMVRWYLLLFLSIHIQYVLDYPNDWTPIKSQHARISELVWISEQAINLTVLHNCTHLPHYSHPLPSQIKSEAANAEWSHECQSERWAKPQMLWSKSRTDWKRHCSIWEKWFIQQLAFSSSRTLVTRTSFSRCCRKHGDA